MWTLPIDLRTILYFKLSTKLRRITQPMIAICLKLVHLDITWVRTQMVFRSPLEFWSAIQMPDIVMSIWIPNHLNNEKVKVRYSDVCYWDIIYDPFSGSYIRQNSPLPFFPTFQKPHGNKIADLDAEFRMTCIIPFMFQICISIIFCTLQTFMRILDLEYLRIINRMLTFYFPNFCTCMTIGNLALAGINWCLPELSMNLHRVAFL